MNKKEHWEKVYSSNKNIEVSWYQEIPLTSIELISKYSSDLQSQIIDIGGGDSFLVDNLIEQGYSSISVLDISSQAIEKSKKRLANKSSTVDWIVSDVTKFKSDENFDIWHDRATFHFLTEDEQIESYISIVNKQISENGFLILGTFSTNGPTKCSGFNVKQYSKKTITELFSENFALVESFQEEHITPFDIKQNFIWNVLRRKFT